MHLLALLYHINTITYNYTYMVGYIISFRVYDFSIKSFLYVIVTLGFNYHAMIK